MYSLKIISCCFLFFVASCSDDNKIEVVREQVIVRNEMIVQYLLEKNEKEFLNIVNREQRKKTIFNDCLFQMESFGTFVDIVDNEFRVSSYGKYGYVTLQYSEKKVATCIEYSDKGFIKDVVFNVLPDSYEVRNNEFMTEEEISVGRDKRLTGVLTLPLHKKNPMCVLFVEGLSIQDDDFSELASDLAKKGFASVRFQTRFKRLPKEIAYISIEEECIQDIASIIHTIFSYPVDSSRIILLASKDNSMMLPKLLEDHPECYSMVLIEPSNRDIKNSVVDAYVKNEAMTEAEKNNMTKNIVEGNDGFGRKNSYFQSLEKYSISNVMIPEKKVLIFTNDSFDWWNKKNIVVKKNERIVEEMVLFYGGKGGLK